MLPRAMSLPKRVLMTLDAVGGQWRYSVDLARALAATGVECVLAGLGPEPNPVQQREVHALRNVALTWIRQPLDWMVQDAAALDEVGDALLALGRAWEVDLLHLNLPSQAALIARDVPVVVTSHSCITTWWAAVRGGALPPPWHWQRTLTARGLGRADAVMVPTANHGAALARAYGAMVKLHVVPNATTMMLDANAGEPVVFSAGRWWDDAKNACTLDAAAAMSRWPVVMAGALSGPSGHGVGLQHARSIGELSADDTRAWMRRAAMFALPAIYEPFGLAVLEAAARGAALILSDIPTFRELWGEAALFVRPDDATSFAAAISRLAAEAALRCLRGRLARHRAAEFTPDRQVDQVRLVYAEALSILATAG